MNLSYRPAQNQDLEEIVQIYNSTVHLRNVTADTEQVSVESKVDWLNKHTVERPLIVCEEEGKIIGWYNLHPFYGRPAYRATVELAIYVHADYRAKGLGKIILQQALKHAQELKIESVLGFIFANNIASLKLFEKEGFNQWGFLPAVAEIDLQKIDLIILGKKI